MSYFETALSFFGFLRDCYKEYIKAQNYTSIFTKVGANMRVKNAVEADWQGEAVQKIDILFSEVHMKEMAMACKDMSGDDLWAYIEQQLRTYYNGFDLQDLDIDGQVAAFKDAFMQRLKTERNDLYGQFFLQEFRNENKKEHLELHKEHLSIQQGQDQIIRGLEAILQGRQVLTGSLQDIQQTLPVLFSKLNNMAATSQQSVLETGDVFQLGLTLNEVERQLQAATRNKNTSDAGLDLDFFDYGNESVDKKITEAIEDYTRADSGNDTVVVSLQCQSKDEGKYYLLRVIKRCLPDLAKKVLVVDQAACWPRVRKLAKGKVLLPVFEAVKIEPVPGNITVLIVTKDILADDKETIRIPKRSRNNLFEKLRLYTKDFDKTHIFIEQTAGEYAPLMRKLSAGMPAKPAWACEDTEPLLAAALAGSWTDKDGDRNIVSELSGLDYETYMAVLRPFMSQEDPFLLLQGSLFGEVYRTTNPCEALWYVKDGFTRKRLEVFAACVKTALLTVHSVVNQIGFTEETGIYSASVKKGLATTLVVLSSADYDYALPGGETVQHFAQAVVREIMTAISEKEHWDAIVELLPLLVEAAPEAVLERIEQCVADHDVNFWSLFVPGKGIYFSNSQYVNVLEALTVALFIKDVSVRALQLLESIADNKIEYKLANTPVNTLSNYFCSWYYEVDITAEEKIQQLQHFAQTRPETCWKVLQNVLPKKLPGIADVFRKPLYRSYTVTDAKSIMGSKKVAIGKEYFKIAFQCAGTDLTKWAYLLENSMFMQYGFKEDLVVTVKLLLQAENTDDDAKYCFEKAIRGFLYRNRFLGKDTVVTTEDLNYLEENLLQVISYTNPVYRFLYAFEDRMLITDPVTAEEDKIGQRQINNNKKNEAQTNILQNVVLTGEIGLEELLDKTADSYELGKKAFEICHNKVFSISFAYCLYSQNKPALLTGYLNAALSQLDDKRFFAILAQTSAQYPEEEFCFRLLETRKIDDLFFERLVVLDHDLQEYYWTNTVNTWFDVPNFARHRDDYVMQLADHGNFRQFTLLLEDLPLKVETYVSILIYILKCNGINNIIGYDIIKIFDKLYAFSIIDKDNRDFIAILEMYCIDAFEANKYYGGPEPRYLLSRLKTEAAFCADIVLYLCQKKDTDLAGNPLGEQEKHNYGCLAMRVLENVKFCPCEEAGSVDENKLAQWCKSFISIMDEAGMAAKGRYFLGSFLANCPLPDDDASWPFPPVCDIIEKYYDKDFEQGFCDAVITNRGCYTDTMGKEEDVLAQKYDRYAHAAELYYPKTAITMRKMSAFYQQEAAQSRSSADNM